MMKLRIAKGVGLLILMATMIGGPVRVSHAQDGGGVTLADLAGKFASRGGGFFTACRNADSTAPEDCATAPNVVPFNFHHGSLRDSLCCWKYMLSRDPHERSSFRYEVPG